MMPVRLSAVLLAGTLGGCTVDLNTRAVCIPERPQAWVGQVYSASAADRIKDMSRAAKVRVLHPDSMATMDFDRHRVNIAVDAAGRIARIYCG